MNKKADKKRIKQIKINQKVAKTLKIMEQHKSTLTASGPELGMALVSGLSARHLKRILAHPEKFELAFPKCDIKHLAESQLIDLHLNLDKEDI